MASIAPVQFSAWSAQSSTSPVTQSFVSPPVNGDGVLVWVGLLNNFVPGNVTGITDNQGTGNVYVNIRSQTDGEGGVNCRSELWWCPSVIVSTGTFSVSVAFTASQFVNVQLIEIVPSTVDRQGSAGTTTFPLTATCTGPNSAANDTAYAFVSVAYGSNNITDPPTGYVSMGTLPLVDGFEEGESCYRLTSGIETSSVTWTWTVGEDGAGIVATFTPVPPPPVSYTLDSTDYF